MSKGDYEEASLWIPDPRGLDVDGLGVKVRAKRRLNRAEMLDIKVAYREQSIRSKNMFVSDESYGLMRFVWRLPAPIVCPHCGSIQRYDEKGPPNLDDVVYFRRGADIPAHSRGGIVVTVLVDRYEDKYFVKVGAAMCSLSDNFSYKKGADISIGRILTDECLSFGVPPDNIAINHYLSPTALLNRGGHGRTLKWRLDGGHSGGTGNS